MSQIALRAKEKGRPGKRCPDTPPQGARPGPEMTNCPTIATALNESLAGPISGLTASLSGEVITLNWAGGSVTSGQSLQATFDLNLPAAVLLDIQATLTNTVIISWPAPSTGFNLQRNSNLNPTDWVGVTDTPTVANGRNQVIVSPRVGTEFYRLKFP
jgi:hypothetical protein